MTTTFKPARWALRIAALCTALAIALPAPAQNLFAPVARVNERAITLFERDQRVRMLELFNAPGIPEDEALTALIDERLQLDEARRLGITLTPDAIATGMTEFAGRANLAPEEFIAALGQAGVEEASFRDFVAAGLVWREVVRARFVGRDRISDADVERAIKRQASAAGLRILVNEVILPANTPAAQAASERRAAEIARITTFPAFASAARSFSVSPSRGVGGRIDALPIGNLPPAIAAQILALAPGEVTAPIAIPNAIALFQLREVQEVPAATPETLELDYAAFYIPGGRTESALAEAARIRALADTCDDLYGIAQGLPPSVLERQTVAAGAVPGDVALELAKLDENEVSTALTRDNGQRLVFLMLCDRRAATPEDAPIDREAVRRELVNQRLAALADAFLAELRANATIRLQ